MQVQEAMRLEEVMRGPGEGVPDARHRANGVGARPQVHQASEELPCSTAQVRLALPVSCTRRCRLNMPGWVSATTQLVLV